MDVVVSFEVFGLPFSWNKSHSFAFYMAFFNSNDAKTLPRLYSSISSSIFVPLEDKVLI
jgi:hypothetical protein